MKETKTLRKFDDVRSSIDEWRTTIDDCGERRQPGRQLGGTQTSREEGIDQGEGFDGD